MRLVSSDGCHDLPYERCILKIGAYNDIFARVCCEDKHYKMGSYESIQNAKNVLEMIHNTAVEEIFHFPSDDDLNIMLDLKKGGPYYEN